MIIANYVIPDPKTEEVHSSAPEAVCESLGSVLARGEPVWEGTHLPREQLPVEAGVSYLGLSGDYGTTFVKVR